jgi:hypothetical protein
LQLNKLKDCRQQLHEECPTAAFNYNGAGNVSFTLQFNTTNPTNFHLIQCPLLRMLGYTGNEIPTIGYPSSPTSLVPIYDIVFSNLPNMNYDSYLNLYISNLPTQTQSANGNLISFKMPLNLAQANTSTTPITYFYQEQNNFVQKIDCEDHGNYYMDRLEFSIIDRYGNVLTATPNDFSFTLEFETSENS